MKISTRSSSPHWALLGSNRQAAGRSIFVWLGLLDTLLLPALAKLLSHKQSGCWVCTYIDSAAHRDCEVASQSKWLRSIWQLRPWCPWFDLHAANTYQSSQLIRFCRITPAVSLRSCSGSTSWSLLVLFGLQAMLLLSTNAELLAHRNCNNYNWQCYLNRPTCSMWAYLPQIFTETMVRTIQCQVVSYNGWKAHGLRLNFTFILGKDLRWIFHISSTRTSCQKWQDCIRVSLCRPCHCFQHLQNCCLANKVVVGSARTLIRLRAATVKRLLKESGSGASGNFNRHARGSIYMLRTLIKAPNWFASAGSLQLSVWGAVPGAQAGLYWSYLDCRPCCSSQQMQNC